MSFVRYLISRVRIVAWGLVLIAFVWLGLQNVADTIKSLNSKASTMGQWATSDSLLSQARVAPSSGEILDALADLPEGDLILFVGGGTDPDFSIAYFHISYFGAPRKITGMRSGPKGQPPMFFVPIPSGSEKLAAIIYYSMQPPPHITGGNRVSPRLIVVPFSKSIKEISDWTYFCP
jgi:hypothetical protein